MNALYDRDFLLTWEHDVATLRAVLETAQALEGLGPQYQQLVVHFDADVVDFNDAPLSEHTGRNTGISLAAAMEALDVLLSDERVVALTITEINPTHAAADDTATKTNASS